MMAFWKAVLILVGMIIGVGMFAIPAAFEQAGFWLGVAELIVLSGVMLAIHLAYGEVVLATPERHRLPGYVREYLGPRVMPVAWLGAFLGILGTLLVYLMVGAVFLEGVFPHASFVAGGERWFWILVIATGAITALPFKKEAIINGALTLALVGFILFLIGYLTPHIVFSSLGGSALQWDNAFIPYGILLFALSGGLVIPDVIAVLGRERALARRAIALGSLIPALLYLLFAFAVVGVSGHAVSREAIIGLAAVVGDSVVRLGGMIGFLAVLTSYILLHKSFQTLLRLDCGVGRLWAWLFPTAMPPMLYLLNIQDFSRVISIVGACAIGIDMTLMVLLWQRVRSRSGIAPTRVQRAGIVALVAMVALGAGFELYRILG